MTQKLDHMNVNAINSSAPTLCEICGSVDHLTLNCQVGSPFAQDTSEVNNVNNFNLSSTNNPYSNTYNPDWRNLPKFSYRLNPNPRSIPQ